MMEYDQDMMDDLVQQVMEAELVLNRVENGPLVLAPNVSDNQPQMASIGQIFDTVVYFDQMQFGEDQVTVLGRPSENSSFYLFQTGTLN